MGPRQLWLAATRCSAGCHGFHEQGGKRERKRAVRGGTRSDAKPKPPCLSLLPQKTVAERTPPTQRQSVQESSYVAHVHSRPASDGICGVLVSDTEYPVRVAFSLLNKTLDEFVIKCPRSGYDGKVNAITTGSAQQPAKGVGILAPDAFPQAQDYLRRYQDPRQADSIMKVQQELDETKIVLVRGRGGHRWAEVVERILKSMPVLQHKTIDSVLKRGEDLDKLVEKSGSLSQQSKM